MARHLRIHYPSALYHAMLRGNNRLDVFLADEDRSRFLDLLADGVERFGHRVHAFCLMTNHIHLAVQVAETPLSDIMQNLAFRYTQWFNRRHGRVGHLFQGRYKAVIVDADSYLLELIRYIHRNPVEAKLVEDAHDYRWSSYRAYLGNASVPWLTTEWVLAQFAPAPDTARSHLDAFVHRSAPRNLPGEVTGGRILGDDIFARDVLDKARQAGPYDMSRMNLGDIVAAVTADYGLIDVDLRSAGKRQPAAEARAVVAFLVRRAPGTTMEEAARRLDHSAKSLSAAATRLDLRRRKAPALAARLERIRDRLKIKM